MNKIITISREFGSGGRELGCRLAEKLQFAYYDKEIIEEIAQRTSLAESYIENVMDHQPMIAYPVRMGVSLQTLNLIQMPSQQIYQAQYEIIKEAAERSDCIIVGRCADYILREMSPLRVFVYSDLPSKIKRCTERKKEYETFTEKELKKNIEKINKGRSQYYSFYTNQHWGAPSNYDLCVNTTHLSIEKGADAIVRFFL